MKKLLIVVALLIPAVAGASIHLAKGQKLNVSNATVVADGGNKITGDNDDITSGWGSKITVTHSVVHTTGGSYVDGGGSSYCYSTKPASDKFVNCL